MTPEQRTFPFLNQKEVSSFPPKTFFEILSVFPGEPPAFSLILYLRKIFAIFAGLYNTNNLNLMEFSSLTRGTHIAEYLWRQNGKPSHPAHLIDGYLQLARAILQEFDTPSSTHWFLQHVSRFLGGTNIDIKLSIDPSIPNTQNLIRTLISAFLNTHHAIIQDSHLTLPYQSPAPLDFKTTPSGILVFSLQSPFNPDLNFILVPPGIPDRRAQISLRQQMATAKLKYGIHNFSIEFPYLQEPQAFFQPDKALFIFKEPLPPLTDLIMYLARTLRFNARFPLENQSYLLPPSELENIAYTLNTAYRHSRRTSYLLPVEHHTLIEAAANFAVAFLYYPQSFIKTIQALDHLLRFPLFPNIDINEIQDPDTFKPRLGNLHSSSSPNWTPNR